MELNLILNNPELLEKTTFYRRNSSGTFEALSESESKAFKKQYLDIQAKLNYK